MGELFFNGRIFTGAGFVPGGFLVEEGRFARVLPGRLTGGDRDLQGAKVLPGLVDLHIHGAAGCDASSGDREALSRMGAFLARRGVTAFLPTTVSLPYPELDRAFRAARDLAWEAPPGVARVLGIRMEGPFFARDRCGAQNPAYLRDPDYAAFQALREGCGGFLRLVDIAPETPGALDFIARASLDCRVSLGHTGADYDTARAAFAAGARHVTHLFNAMPPLHHRSPGLVAAAAEREDVTAELIADGHHIHPAVVRLAFRLFPGRLCLISDAISCCGMPEGAYRLGGQPVFLGEGAVRLPDGTLAGAASDLFRDLRSEASFGVPEADAILAATRIPARVAGAEKELGSIAPGRRADFVVSEEDLSPRQVYLGGVPLG